MRRTCVGGPARLQARYHERRRRTGVASLLAGTPASPKENFFVIRRLLAAGAADKPVVLVLVDLHWAELLPDDARAFDAAGRLRYERYLERLDGKGGESSGFGH